jgi:flagellar biogenesis protein FliO
MFEQLLAEVQNGTEIQKALFVMAAGVLGVFLVLAFFYGLIHLLRRVLKK